MHLFGTVFPQQFHQFTAGCAAHDRVIHNSNPFALQRVTNRIQFQFYHLLPHFLRWLNKASAGIPVFQNPLGKRNAAFLCIPDCRCGAGIRNGNHNIHIQFRFFCQLSPHQTAGFVYVNAVDVTVWTGNINKFKNYRGKSYWAISSTPN